MKRLFLLFLILPFLCTAQQSSTIFQTDLNLTQAKEKAKKENKYLLVNCYSIISVVSDQMTNKVFTQREVIDFLNKNFINVEFQIDEFLADKPAMKNHYKEAQKIIRQYNLEFYPTFLIFSPQGELVHQVIGGHDTKDFITNARKALDPETQYFTLLKKFRAGDRSPAILKTLASDENLDNKLKNKVYLTYLASQKDLLTTDNLAFLAEFTSSTKSPGFKFILKNQKKVDSIMGKDAANKILSSIIIRGEINPLVNKSDGSIDFNKLYRQTNLKYPSIDIFKDMLFLKVKFYEEKENWPQFEASILDYMQLYKTELNAVQLNEYASKVFTYCNGIKCHKAALKWSKQSIIETAGLNPIFIDTYACLLFKLGHIGKAIEWEEKAISICSEAEKGKYMERLKDIKSAVKTWY